MPRSDTVFVCSACGHEAARWAGRCPDCTEWNTLVEQRRPSTAAVGRGGAAGGARGSGRRAGAGTPVAPVRLRDVEAIDHERLSTGIGELDSVLGGGVVPGSLVLIGGAPGIGKSTLTTMALANMCAAGRRTLYVSAEESAAQIRLRAQRLGGGEGVGGPVVFGTR